MNFDSESIDSLCNFLNEQKNIKKIDLGWSRISGVDCSNSCGPQAMTNMVLKSLARSDNLRDISLPWLKLLS